MQLIIFIIHVIAAASLIALVLLQHGKGADAGAAFGSGASQTMFGSTGSLPFLTKITAIIAAVFFASSLVLGYFTAKQVKQQTGEMTAPWTTEQQSTPSAPVPMTTPMPATAPASTEATQAASNSEVASETTSTVSQGTTVAPAQKTQSTKIAKSAKKVK